MALQAGLFSAVLTSFIIDSKQNLQPNPAEQTVYFLQKAVALLDQISQQISTIAPQASIPSAQLPPLPAFNKSSSDIRINVFWFMALVFSLSTALLAILVQQWVRNYMHVFQRYGDPLKSARLRQYLCEGSEKWYMPVVADAVPGFLHVSLFLFFAGLCDSVWHIDTRVALGTTVPIGASGLVYTFTTIAPAIYPQSPYQNSFSFLIWYLIQKLGGRKYKDRRSGGILKAVSSNKALGQMELAMEEMEERKVRDEHAIRWLVGSLTEDAEMESLTMAIPGSLNTEWGLEVWKRVSGVTDPVLRRRTTKTSPYDTTPHSPNAHPHNVPAPHQGEDVVDKLSRCVVPLLKDCNNRDLFANDELWRTRTRACIETTAWLVCCADAKLDHFGDIMKLLGDIGRDQKSREYRPFLMRWTCLSLINSRLELKGNLSIQMGARIAARFIKGDDEPADEEALVGARMIDETFEKAWRELGELNLALTWDGNVTEAQVYTILLGHENQILELEHINTQADSLERVDRGIFEVQSSIGRASHEIVTCQLPGIQFDDLHAEPVPFSQTVMLFRDPLQVPFILPAQKLKSICSIVSTFREILEGQWDAEAYQEALKNLGESFQVPTWWTKQLLQRQLWRLEDLGEGGGLGFTVELFFLALRQLLCKASSKELHSVLYIGTFQAITSDWKGHKNSLGTQKLLLDIVVSENGIISSFDYPAYIKDELLKLLRNVLEGQTGQHIDDAVEQLQNRFEDRNERPTTWWAKVLEVIPRPLL